MSWGTASQAANPPVLTRRALIAAAGGLAAAGVGLEFPRLLGSTPMNPVSGRDPSPPSTPARTFVSRGDLRPAAVSAAGSMSEPGYVLLAPQARHGAQAGPLIVDDRGQPVWFRPVSGGRWATNFRVQSYRGEPVLTWWEGLVDDTGYGRGEGVIVDSRYREVSRVRAGHGRSADMHEFIITPQGTALITCYPAVVAADLTAIGGARDGTVFESIIQEVAIGSGRVLLEWRSLEHVPVSESHRSPTGVCDYLHANSIEVLPDGGLLVSGRHTWTVYRLERRTGAVVWRLGGKRSDYSLGAGARFAWQHDARHPAPGLITLFDDSSDGDTRTAAQSRGLVLAVDDRWRTARVLGSYLHPRPLLASAMGSVQLLAGGHVVVGWGSEPYLSEFAGTRRMTSELRLADGQQSYRGLRFEWRGRPQGVPAIAVRSSAAGTPTLYASWNGATDVDRWQLRAGSSHREPAHVVGTAPRRGFETAIQLPSGAGSVAVTALDSRGRELGTSRAVTL